MRRVLYFCLIVSIAALSPPLAVAAETAEDAMESAGGRPRIGLVLGGGGARGAAHIGVLRELERLRIPIDAIAGTSMGAIVGGLYAAGMSPADLQELVETLDWADAMSDKPRRRDLSFRRKQDDTEFPIDIGVGIRNGDFVLPKGLIRGQKLDLTLRELTLGVSQIHDFDELDIPFRAIASDLESGEAVVMGTGDLARSIRASMSVPALFAPVELDGRLLVDGGIAGNLPIDVMQMMGVDIVIAVSVEFPLYSAADLQSVLSISEQVLTILMRKETLRQIDLLGEQDLLIQPDLGLFASTNFAAIEQAIEPGREATLAVAEQLEIYSLNEQAYAEHLANRTNPSQSDETLAFVRVVQDGPVKPEVLESRLDTETGDPVDPRRLAADANRLYGMKLFDHVSYRLVEENGATGVEFEAKSRELGPNYLQFGISLEDDLEGSTAFNLSTRLTRTGINALGAEWRTDLQLGTDPEFFSEFYQPLNASSLWFLAPRIEFGQSNLNAFVMGDNLARYRISEAQFGLDFGAELGTSAEIRVGAFSGSGKAVVKVGDPSLPNVEFDTGGILARLRFDSFDHAWFPRRGVRANAQMVLSRPGLGADDSFETIDANLSAVFSRGKSSFEFGLGFETNTGSDVEVQNYFPMGGFMRLSGLERGQISGPHAGLARIVYYRRVSNSAGGVLIDMPVYIGASIEVGDVWQTRSAISFDSLRTHGSIFLGLDSFLGPMYLAGGFGEGGDRNLYLYIGSRPR